MKQIKLVSMLALLVVLFAACAPSQSGTTLSRFSGGFANDFAKRSGVTVFDCPQSVIDNLTSDGSRVLCGGTNDGFQNFAVKNQKAATDLGASKATDWKRGNSDNLFSRNYVWDSGDEVGVYYLASASGGGAVIINY